METARAQVPAELRACGQGFVAIPHRDLTPAEIHELLARARAAQVEKNRCIADLIAWAEDHIGLRDGPAGR